MSKTLGIHEIAKSAYYMDREPKITDRAPRWLREKIERTTRRANLRRRARHAIEQSGERSTAHLSRDYRGFERDGSRKGPGSGRSADWLDTGFEHYQVLARAVHEQMGYSDQTVRDIVRTLTVQRGGWDVRSAENAALEKLPPCTAALRPTHDNEAEAFDRQMAAVANAGDHTGAASEHVIRWRLWMMWNGNRAIGEYDAWQRLARIARNPSARINGYLADSIRSWRGLGGHDYSGCSGCQSYAIHREHPEHWDLLMSRAPTGTKTDDAEQVYPHEHERATQLRAAGWQETMRLNDSIFTRPSQP